MIRPLRILAIARRDLAIELAGRQGLLLPAIMAGLLLPASLIPSPLQKFTASYEGQTVRAHGDIPPEWNGTEDFDASSRFVLTFTKRDDVLLVDGPFIPTSVRDKLDALDSDSTRVTLEDYPRGFLFPGRTALLSLVAASTLTGAVSQSIGGERQRKTLVVLLAAAISRTEIVLGKWVAWGGLGAGSAMASAFIALVLGNVEPGAWLVPLPTVPLGTVALGLWLVRRSSDVMAGSATALRVLPATFSILGVVAWFVGDHNPWMSALIPLGGALLAAGQTWPEAGPTLLAAVSTLVFTGVMLAATVRDLEENPERSPPEERTGTAAVVGALAAIAWWLPIAAPELWRLAGNEKITAGLPLERGILAGSASLLLFSVVRATRTHQRLLDELALRITRASLVRSSLLAFAASLALAAISYSSSLTAWGTFGDAAMQQRFAIGLHLQTIPLPLAVLSLLADELLFRGWLQRVAGSSRALLVWTVVKTPLDPLTGLLTGAVCTGVASASGSIWPSLFARLAVLLMLS